jgi:hypothetical protein
MDLKYWLAINGIVCLVLMFVILHFLNKDYNLNGAKRILSSSKYGRIAYWCSLFLLVWFICTVNRFIDVLIDEKVLVLSPSLYNLLYWLGVPLLGFIYVGSIIWTAYINYKTRKRDNIKYDKHDI